MGDFRYAIRLLAKNPGFTIFTVVLLAIGIGGNAVVFSALNAVLLRPLPAPHPEQLVRMVQKVPQLGTRSNFPYAFYEALSAGTSSFAHVFGEYETPAVISQPGAAAQIRMGLVTPEYFETIGVSPLYGRWLDRSRSNEAVLSYLFWKTRFNGDRNAVGRTIVLNRNAFVVAGVMPRDFNGISIDTGPDLRAPLSALPLLNGGDPELKVDSEFFSLDLAGRLKPGVTLAHAQAECLGIYRPVVTERLKSQPNFTPKDVEIELSRGVILDSLQRGVSIIRDRYGKALELIGGAVGVLLLLLCANIAGLMTARNASRRDEIAVRLAVGATRGRLMRQILTETVLITAIGAIAGVAAAYGIAPLLTHALPPVRDLSTRMLPLTIDFTPDGRVLLFAAAASLLTALLFGLPPAIVASGAGIDSVLREARSTSGWRTRQTLAVLQVALCTLLLPGAGLLVRTFVRLQTANVGFDRDHIVVFSAEPYLMGYSNAQTAELTRALRERIRSMPDVTGVATASIAVMRGSGMKFTVAPTGQRLTRADFLNASTNAVSPEYFETMGMRVLEGRPLAQTDESKQKPLRVVVNEAFVRRFFPGIDPVGRTFGHALETEAKADYQIVGVVNDAKYRSLREPIPPTVFSVERAGDTFQLLVRTRGRPEVVIQPVRDALRALDPALPFTEIRTIAEDADASTAAERTTAEAASMFGALAAILSGVGIYGLLAYAVAQRRREIGIRVALGARPAQVVEFLARQSLWMAAAGVALGLVAAMLIGGLLRPLLYGIGPWDAGSYAMAAGVVVVVAASATALPSLRAAGMDPAAALRTDR